MNSERPSLPRNGGQPAFDLCQQLLAPGVCAGLVQHLRRLIAGEYKPRQRPPDFIVAVDIRAAQRRKLALAVFQRRNKPVEGIEQRLLRNAQPAFLMPHLGKIHASLEIRYKYPCVLFNALHQQQLEQNAFSAAGRTAQKDMGNVREVDRHGAGIPLAKHQHRTFAGKAAVIPTQHLRQFLSGGNGIYQHAALAPGVCQLDNVYPQRRLNGGAFFLPFINRNAPVIKLPYRNAGIAAVAAFVEQIRRYTGVVHETDALKPVPCHPPPYWIEQQRRAAKQQICSNGIPHQVL